MKKTLFLAAAASAMFAFAGCTKDAIEPINPNTPDSKLATISATTAPQKDETRTSLSDGDILWTEGNQIMLRLASDGAKSAVYTLKTGAGTTTGTFEGEALPEGAKWAFYPMSGYYQPQSAADQLSFTRPLIQPYKFKSFGNGANPMVAKSDEAGENLAFQNICGAIRLKLTGTATVKLITVTSAVEGENIAGDGMIDMTYTDEPQVRMYFSSAPVVLSNINEPLDPATPKEFTIILPPGAYAPGMVFSIETSDGLSMNKATTIPITVQRSKVLPLAAFEVVAKPYNFPDKNFRAFLKELGFVLNNVSSLDEDIDINNATNKEKFNSMTEIACNNKQIASLTGIEYFKALTRLDCSNNLLTSLDLSANTALETLQCNSNQLTSLKQPATTTLGHINCANNQLTSLKLWANTKLYRLNCEYNQLTMLDLSANTALEQIYCYNNRLSMLDLTHNTLNILSYAFWIGAQVAADGTLLDMKAYVSDKQTSELNANKENARATLSRDPVPTPAPPMR